MGMHDTKNLLILVETDSNELIGLNLKTDNH